MQKVHRNLDELRVTEFHSEDRVTLTSVNKKKKELQLVDRNNERRSETIPSGSLSIPHKVCNNLTYGLKVHKYYTSLQLIFHSLCLGRHGMAGFSLLFLFLFIYLRLFSFKLGITVLSRAGLTVCESKLLNSPCSVE